MSLITSLFVAMKLVGLLLTSLTIGSYAVILQLETQLTYLITGFNVVTQVQGHQQTSLTIGSYVVTCQVEHQQMF
jgi:hypothetical protein